MQLSACLRADLVRVSASSVSARSSEQIVRTLWRADCPCALATGLPARFMCKQSPASSCKRIAPASRSGGAHLPLPQRQPVGLCGVQRQQWSWWPAAVACAVQHSLTEPGTNSRDDPNGRFVTVLSIMSVLANRLPLEGISNNNKWENLFRTPFFAHHKPKYIGPISANAGVPCTME